MPSKPIYHFRFMYPKADEFITRHRKEVVSKPNSSLSLFM